MSDYEDLVKRLTAINADSEYSDEAHWSGEAATAIETLLRERDVYERLSHSRGALLVSAQAERDAAIKERDEAFQKYVDANEARIDAIARAEKAELQVTEYELARDAVLCELGRDLNAVNAERDTLRALLREAHVKMVENNLWSNLRARIDAALKGGEDC